MKFKSCQLAAFNTRDAIENTVYLSGAGHSELIAPESYESDAANVAGPVLRLSHQPADLSGMAGGEAYLKDLPMAEMHRLNAGHFATEDNLPFIASHIISFFDKRVKR